MSHGYRVVQWTPFKKAYDLMLTVGVLGFLVAYAGTTAWLQGAADALTPPQLLIRTFGAGAFVLLTLVLAIGAAGAADPRFLPLLYNRRHLGVTTASRWPRPRRAGLVRFHGFGDDLPLSLLDAPTARGDAIQGGLPFRASGCWRCDPVRDGGDQPRTSGTRQPRARRCLEAMHMRGVRCLRACWSGT